MAVGVISRHATEITSLGKTDGGQTIMSEDSNVGLREKGGEAVI